MEETPIFIEMNYSTTIDFIGKKNVEYLTTRREHYRISIILSVTGDGYKLPPFVIIKGEEGKTIEKNLMNYILLKKMNYTSIAKSKDGAHQNYLYNG